MYFCIYENTSLVSLGLKACVAVTKLQVDQVGNV